MENKETVVNVSHVMKEKARKVEELRAEGLEPYARRYDKKENISEILNYDENSEKEFQTAGRIVSYRRMGKNGFAHIQDLSGKIQFYAKKDEIGDDKYEIYKKMATGDFVGVKGKLFRTQTGELTIKASDIEILTKNVRPLPDKFSGLQDIEMRYRQRYVDLVMNPEVQNTMKKRFEIIRFIPLIRKVCNKSDI